MKQIPKDAALLAEDETTLRLFPPLRSAWAPIGEQARVPITGQNARCVLFGAIDLRCGRLIVLKRPGAKAADFHAFLRHLRSTHSNRPIWLLLDEASCHTAKSSLRLAAELDITLLSLPRQSPQLNPVDHLWKELKGRISANRQFASINETARYAIAWLRRLDPKRLLRKAGVLAQGFWLRKVL